MVFRRIKDLREDNDLTQVKIAEVLHMERRTYATYESGTRSVSPEVLIAIADFYNVNLDYLVGRTDVKTRLPKAK